MKISEIVAEVASVESVPEEKILALARRIRGTQKRSVKISRPPESVLGFPELIVVVPATWPYVDLAPLYDVHFGHDRHHDELFMRHWHWLAHNPYALTFDGGDFIENATKLSVGEGVYDQRLKPYAQLKSAVIILARLWKKLLFKLPGNHEDRTRIAGMDAGSWLASIMEVPYFPDFCFCTIRFAGNNFRLLAHHGVGAATTAGAQRMAARKMVGWAKGFDIFWTGHLHNPMLDVIFQTDFDHSTGRAFERDAMIVISPSYLRYFRSYAAKKMYPPAPLGMHVLRLQRDGRIDASIHARGRRL